MHLLTRQIRLSINPPGTDFPTQITNSYAGHPPHSSLSSHFFTLCATLAGPLQPSGYLLNIKDIDSQLRTQAIPLLQSLLIPQPGTRNSELGTHEVALNELHSLLKSAWPGCTLHTLTLSPTPYLSYSTTSKDFPMTTLSQKFEFSASHRLHNPSLSDDDNRSTYGKCNNPHGHGHNYELQITLAGTPDPSTGALTNLHDFERTVSEVVIAKFDHKHLNTQLPEFATTIPTVENIAQIIYTLLKPHLQSPRTRLASVTLWETPKTWSEYSEP